MKVQKIESVGFDASKEPRSHVKLLGVRENYAADIQRLKEFWDNPYPAKA